MSIDNKSLELRWGDGNSKVSKLADMFGRTVTFGLPAFQSASGFKVCPGAGACAAVCFARQGHYVQNQVKAIREHNLAFARKNPRAFARAVVRDLKRLKAKLVRVHDSGDFFSQAYLNAWYMVARALPGVRFYAYTKSLHLDLWTNQPENFAITQSEGGIYDLDIDPEKSHARIFANNEARKRAGYGNGSNTDLKAIRAVPGTKIGLIYHGVAKLTPQQARFFGSRERKDQRAG